MRKVSHRRGDLTVAVEPRVESNSYTAAGLWRSYSETGYFAGCQQVRRRHNPRCIPLAARRSAAACARRTPRAAQTRRRGCAPLHNLCNARCCPSDDMELMVPWYVWPGPQYDELVRSRGRSRGGGRGSSAHAGMHARNARQPHGLVCVAGAPFRGGCEEQGAQRGQHANASARAPRPCGCHACMLACLPCGRSGAACAMRPSGVTALRAGTPHSDPACAHCAAAAPRAACAAHAGARLLLPCAALCSLPFPSRAPNHTQQMQFPNTHR